MKANNAIEVVYKAGKGTETDEYPNMMYEYTIYRFRDHIRINLINPTSRFEGVVESVDYNRKHVIKINYSNKVKSMRMIE